MATDDATAGAEVIRLRQALRMVLSDPSEEALISGAPCRRSRWFDAWRWDEWTRLAWPEGKR